MCSYELADTFYRRAIQRDPLDTLCTVRQNYTDFLQVWCPVVQVGTSLLLTVTNPQHTHTHTHRGVVQAACISPRRAARPT